MRILVIADFRTDHPRFLLNNSRMWVKGLVRNGHDVVSFSYREVLLGQSWIPSRRWALRLAKGKTDKILAEIARHHQSELILITGFHYGDAETVRLLRQALPHAKLVCWYGDLRQGVDEKVLAVGKEMDLFTATSAGRTLRQYHEAGVGCCLFLPNPVDDDIETAPEPGDSYRHDAVFIGKLMHKQPGQDETRKELIERLYHKGTLTVYGAMGEKATIGKDYIRALHESKIALSINAFNDVEQYHSDRLMHCLGCGVFTVAKRVPRTEVIAQDGKHVRYFDSIEQCEELIAYYLQHEAERQEIAAAGREWVMSQFHCRKLAAYLVAMAQGEEIDEPWYERVT